MAKVTVEQALQQAVVDLIELSLRGKQMHWNIQGDNFRSLHLHLDEIIDQVRLDGDEAAERLITIGTAPDGRAETVAKTTTLQPVAEGILSTDKVYQQMEADLLSVSETIKATLDAVDEADPLTGDLLIGICRNLEKQAWMLRAQGK
ncbi:DNA starvation/stationary phase protection protein [Nanchangia anserum]|uniref:DNA starvation/stationary phase protection protein n=1 Tax=Nanchangia anserum TaxID=2692125 RepID=A0A8I0GDZ4_9ACTO|nr:DNA starvation/stationary phase protection protein [Nanchangia anserum]MBD3689112.1 DNA starvation/stationary phase protection protein [Nanchangia anserum]QOX81347.1 DNA starvation/stationary phase protection protein [Nanchangia anserum]